MFIEVNTSAANGVGELFLGHIVKDHIEVTSQKKYYRKNEIKKERVQKLQNLSITSNHFYFSSTF